MTETWECHDGIFGFPEDRKLQPGVLNEDAVHVFTRGHCHSFAEAVVRVFPSAKLVFAYDYCEEDGPEEDVEGHVMVKIDRRYLDVRGWLDEVESEAERDVESFWSRVKLIDKEGWLLNSDGWFDLRIDDAIPFALAVLGGVGLKVGREQLLLAAMVSDGG